MSQFLSSIPASIPLLLNSHHGRLASRKSTDVFPSLLIHLWLPPQETLNCASADLGSSLYSLGANPEENTVSVVIAQQYFECCLRIRCSGNVFIRPLPSNGVCWFPYFVATAVLITVFTELTSYCGTKTIRVNGISKWVWKTSWFCLFCNVMLTR
jgi:hypothetical protein